MKNQRNFGLDLARSIAITLVFSNHLITNILKTDLGPFWYLAYFGVEIFFGLSGFLIGEILIKMCDEKTGLFTPKDTFKFLIRRFFRTAPLYFILLGVNFCVGKFLLKNVYSFDWHYLLWLQNFSRRPASFFGESWSLCIEEWFYLIFSTSLCVFMFLTRRWKTGIVDKVLLFTIVYIVLFSIIRFAYSDYHNEFNVVIFRLDAIAYGILMAVLNRKKKFESFRHAIGMTGSFLMLAGILLFLFKTRFPSFYILYYNLTGLGVASCIWYIQKTIFIQEHKFFRKIKFYSKISYSIYLVNLLVIYLLLFFLQDLVDSYFLLLLGFGFVISFSCITYKYIELPFLGFRDKYFSGNRGEWNLLRTKKKLSYSFINQKKIRVLFG